VVRLLLEAGADVKQKDAAGKTALERAAERGGDPAIVKLLESGAGKSKNLL
jgi:ankyrin repeat protein